jgi:hypothetical protein
MLAGLLAVAAAIVGGTPAYAAGSPPVCAPPACVFPGKPELVQIPAAGTKAPARGVARLQIRTKGLARGRRAAITIKKRGRRATVKNVGKSFNLSALKPGKWTVAAAPLVVGSKVLYPRPRQFTVTIKPHARGSVSFDYSNALKSSLRYVRGDAVSAMTGPTTGGEYTFVINDPRRLIAKRSLVSVAAGKLTPSGFMLKPRRVTRKGKLATVVGTQGQLTDLGEFSFSISKDVPLPADMVKPKSRRGVGPSPLLVTPAESNFRPFSCSGRVTDTVTQHEFFSDTKFAKPSVHLDGRMSHGIIPTFTADVSEHVETTFGLSLSEGVGCTLQARTPPVFLAGFPVGDLPIYMVVEVQLGVKADGTFGGTFSTEATESLDLKVGFDLNPLGPHPHGSVDPGSSFSPGEYTGSGTLKAWAGPILVMTANGLPAGEIAAGGVLKLTWNDADADPWKLSGGIEATGTVTLAGLLTMTSTSLFSKEWPIATANTGGANTGPPNGGPHVYSNRIAEGFDLGGGYFWNSYDTGATHPLRYGSCFEYYCVYTTGMYPAEQPSSLIYDSQTIARYLGNEVGPVSAGEGGVGPVQCVAVAQCYGVTSGGVLKYFNGSTWEQSSSNESGFGHQSIDRLSCAPGICVGAGYIGELNIYTGPTAPQKLHIGISVYDIDCVSAAWCMVMGRKNLGGDATLGYWTLENGVLSAFHADTVTHEPTPGNISCASPTLCFGNGGYLYRWDGEKWAGPAEKVGSGYSLYDVSCQKDGSNTCVASNSDGYTYVNTGAGWVESAKLTPPDDALLKLSCGTPTYCGALEGVPPS